MHPPPRGGKLAGWWGRLLMVADPESQSMPSQKKLWTTLTFPLALGLFDVPPCGGTNN